MICSARNSSRRWTTVTCDAMFDRYRASSTAVLPPPITATGWFLKKNPSQVAHAETPRPLKASSVGKPRYFADAPVAMISASHVYSVLPQNKRNGRDPKLDAVDVIVE